MQEATILKEGDIVTGLGTIDTNHCGLPWVATVSGDLLFGVLQIKGTPILIDALSGQPLTRTELNKREGNLAFDYGNKFSSR